MLTSSKRDLGNYCLFLSTNTKDKDQNTSEENIELGLNPLRLTSNLLSNLFPGPILIVPLST